MYLGIDFSNWYALQGHCKPVEILLQYTKTHNVGLLVYTQSFSQKEIVFEQMPESRKQKEMVFGQMIESKNQKEIVFGQMIEAQKQKEMVFGYIQKVQRLFLLYSEQK